MTHKNTWKALERKSAAILGGQRAPSDGTGGVDVEHPTFAIECKYRAKLGFKSWFEQAERYANESGKVPLLVCKQKHERGEYAILRLTDLAELLRQADAP